MFSFVNKGMKVIPIHAAVSELPIAVRSSSMSATSKVRTVEWCESPPLRLSLSKHSRSIARVTMH